MDPPDESPPEDQTPEPPAAGSPFAEPPPGWRPPRIPPRYFGPIGPPPQYGLHPYAPPFPGGANIATWALIFSIIGAFGMLGCCYLGLPMSIAALVLAIVAKQKIKENPETPGNGQATAALIISGIVLGLVAMGIVAWMGLIGIGLWGGF